MCYKGTYVLFRCDNPYCYSIYLKPKYKTNRTPRKVDGSNRNYCSKRCFSLGDKTILDIIANKITINPLTECWEWVQSYNDYPVLRYSGQYLRAGRTLFEFFYGPTNRKLHLLHKCDNPPCVNPDHLFLGTNDDNVRDKLLKGRGACGEKLSNVLTTSRVKTIRALYKLKDKGYSRSKLASIFNLNYNTLKGVLSGRRWKHI